MENQTPLASASVINDCPFLNKALTMTKLRQHSKRDLKAPQAEAVVQRIEVTIIVATSSSQTRNTASHQFTRNITHPPCEKKHRPLILLAATGRCLLQTNWCRSARSAGAR